MAVSAHCGVVRNQYHRMAIGGARLSPYSFRYIYPQVEDQPAGQCILSFDVIPDSQPPTNVHVIIGRNGVGKSRLLNHLANIRVEPSPGTSYGTISFGGTDEPAESQFANLVSVAFSAFDDFDPILQPSPSFNHIQYSYIGLKGTSDNNPGETRFPKTNEDLAREFSSSVTACLEPERFRRWRRGLEELQSDPIFADARVSDLADDRASSIALETNAYELFQRLSSGHKIVLLTITRLVETVKERSLILLDEPESHLHPPLLAAFVRALSNLLIDRNGVAIIATHSPVVLQEVPHDCVWKLRRSGLVASADRPDIETFGENVGVLTHEVFGLEVTHSGFYKMLAESVERDDSSGDVLQRFGDKLGGEARALIQVLIAQRDANRLR
jgi:predicted ATPase